jgi:hypothetical protein
MMYKMKHTETHTRNHMRKSDISPQAQEALRTIRALRALPETSSTIAAERRIISRLNITDTTAVALELAVDDVELDGGVR